MSVILVTILIVTVYSMVSASGFRVAIGKNNEAAGSLLIRISSKSRYQYVCDEGFTDHVAGVICKDHGYRYGKAMLGSTIGAADYAIGITNIACPKKASSFSDCTFRTNGTCVGQHYASVACANEIIDPQSGLAYTLELSGNEHHGLVIITYFQTPGYICGDNFDTQAAGVICRQLNPRYTSGISYRVSNDHGRIWLRDAKCVGYERRLIACRLSAWGNATGCAGTTAGVICFKRGYGYRSRIVGPEQRKGAEGRLEIRIGRSWATVCAVGFTNVAATVACREKGFEYGRVTKGKNYLPKSTSRYVMWKVVCTGKERTLADCKNAGLTSRDNNQCSGGSSDVTLFCYNSVRLNGRDFHNYGQLEMEIETKAWSYTWSYAWSYISERSINRNGIRVACRSMGFEDGVAECCTPYDDHSSRLHTHPSPVSYNCQGDEPSLDNCTKIIQLKEHERAITVLCLDSLISEKVSFAPDLEKQYSGTVRVTEGGSSFFVCPSQWTNAEAAVFCRQNGYPSGGISEHWTALLTTPYFVGEIRCNGTETNLNDCTIIRNNASVRCDSVYDAVNKVPVAGVLCYTKVAELRYQLADGLGRVKGRAEIHYGENWGTICTRNMTAEQKDLAARVFCRSLGQGYPSGYASQAKLATTKVASSTTPTYMAAVKCRGSEMTLFNCEHEWIKDIQISGCKDHMDDLVVTCHKAVRLVSSGAHSGIVYISTDGKNYRTVCADGFDDTDANVVCRRDLGFSQGVAICCAAFGYNAVPADRTNVQCEGDESSVALCRHDARPFSLDKCHRRNYAAVHCYNGKRPQKYASLSLSGLNYAGYVVLHYLNIRGCVCPDSWNDKSAQVVCRELNFKGGESYIHIRSSNVTTESYGPYWATNVTCRGTETSLNECYTTLGKVTQCRSRYIAGVLCYTNRGGVKFRLAGENSEGHVEAGIDGDWRPLCRPLSSSSAAVICREFGYIDGIPRKVYKKLRYTGTAWQMTFLCRGDEEKLRDCPHSGWTKPQPICDQYAAVTCLNSVSLQTGRGERVGPLLVRINQQWYLSCDSGFDDFTAKLACRAMGLGFVDGRAILGSAYGTNNFEDNYDLAGNYTVSCQGHESKIEECIRKIPCNSTTYASVICMRSNDPTDESVTFLIEDGNKNHGEVVVSQFGITGRVCAVGWDDDDAQVLCREALFKYGVAYIHDVADKNFDQVQRGLFLFSDFACSNTNKSLRGCRHSNRLDRTDCSRAHTAGVYCMKTQNIEYRLVNTDPLFTDRGRVEMAIDGVWGTVCDTSWTDENAIVFCSSIGQGAGIVWKDTTKKRGSGPIWLNHVNCTGKESWLHSCQHRGFNATIYGDKDDKRCGDHAADAAVRCIGTYRLSTGLDAATGALEIWTRGEKSWFRVCGDNWNAKSATTACKQLGFQYGVNIPGNAFSEVAVTQPRDVINCTSVSSTLLKCSHTMKNVNCGRHVSVACLNDAPKKGHSIRIAKDDLSGDTFGTLEVNVNGVWGRICMKGWTEVNSNVACKSLGFKGGMTYLHPTNHITPIVMNGVMCEGGENNVWDCNHQLWSTNECHYKAKAVGVICHTTDRVPRWAVSENVNENHGFVSLTLDGKYMEFCDRNWNQLTATVYCRQIGYVDGYFITHAHDSFTHAMSMVAFHCDGTETSLLTCRNNGWESTAMTSECKDHMPAWVACYTRVIGIADVRLTGIMSYGRVEVLVHDIGLWGMICAVGWDDRDANVVCRELGYQSGVATSRRLFEGTWHLTSHVDCTGTESRLADCPMRRLGMSECTTADPAAYVNCHLAQTTKKAHHHTPTTTTTDDADSIIIDTTTTPPSAATRISLSKTTILSGAGRIVGGERVSRIPAIISTIIMTLISMYLSAVGTEHTSLSPAS